MSRLMHAGFLLARPMTLGVRCAAFDETGHVFLVRHTYVEGWYLPGGGVEPGEPAVASLRRELGEEGNLEMLAEPRLVGVYLNRAQSRRDHVVFYHCDRVRQTAPRPADREIAESGFFALHDLPLGVTSATWRRLEELRTGSPPDPCW